MRLEDLTDREQSVIRIIVQTGGEDYDFWPFMDDSLTYALNKLDERDIVAIMGNGDVQIVDLEIKAEALKKWPT